MLDKHGRQLKTPKSKRFRRSNRDTLSSPVPDHFHISLLPVGSCVSVGNLFIYRFRNFKNRNPSVTHELAQSCLISSYILETFWKVGRFPVLHHFPK